MALDERKETDSVTQVEGFRLLVDKKLLELSEGIEVDYLDEPFRVGFQVRGKNSAAFGC